MWWLGEAHRQVLAGMLKQQSNTKDQQQGHQEKAIWLRQWLPNFAVCWRNLYVLLHILTSCLCSTVSSEPAGRGKACVIGSI